MRRLLFFCILVTGVQAGWQVAKPGWKYQFPRDHGNHPEFKIEWWYFSGNLQAADGREFGYQLTFFRQGVMPSDADIIPLSRFVTNSVKFAHFAVSDISGGEFHFAQKLSRGAFGEAGFAERERLAWIDDWQGAINNEETFHIQAKADNLSIDLTLKPAKPLVIHGKDGISKKAEGEGRASHYYSFTRLSSEGVLRIAGEEFAVTGLSWFDHEWATNQLAENQLGWNWFSLQLDDGSELMLIQFRTTDGQPDPNASGTFVDANGNTTPLAHTDFTIEALETWTSTQTGARYPVTWRITVPSLDIHLDLRAVLKDQELRLKPIVYWEGAIRLEGRIKERSVKGSGYLEMTGYADPLDELQAQP